MLAGLTAAPGCGGGPRHQSGSRPEAAVLVELDRFGRNAATLDHVVVRQDGAARVLIGHGGAGTRRIDFRLSRARFARLRRILHATDLVHPGPADRDPGLHGGSVYFYVLRLDGRSLRVVDRAEPPHARAAVRVLGALIDGDGRPAR